MEKRVKITVVGKAGEILVSFSEGGNYKSMENSVDLEPAQLQWITARSISYEMLMELKQAPSVKNKLIIEEVPLEVDFDLFWNTYDYKVEKKSSITKWNRMSKKEQLKAFLYIAKYKTRAAKDKIPLKYPSSYLNAELWND